MIDGIFKKKVVSILKNLIMICNIEIGVLTKSWEMQSIRIHRNILGKKLDASNKHLIY